MEIEKSIAGNQFNMNALMGVSGKNKKAKGFRAFNVNESIIQAIKTIGYKFPTPIQRRTIPDIVSGFNVIAHSRTGSGKTAAFLIPILNRLKEHSKIVGARCLILSPTRELAHQTLSFCKKLGRFMNLRYTLLVGGNELEGQFEKLAQNPDIIIATPGRVMHHLSEGSLSLKKVEILAIDEADKIFELNFEEQVKIILKGCPPSRQVLLFSATIPQQLAQFMKTGIREYKLINIDEENKIPDKLKIHLLYTRSEEKKYALIALLTNPKILNVRQESTLIFVSTKYHCEYLFEFLKYWRIESNYIYGQMDQQLRDKNLELFRKKRVNTLIVTDVAARGLDIPMMENVINFDFPDTTKLFIHRVGRTARAGREGRVFNFIAPNELAYFFDIKVSLGKKLTLHTEDMESDLHNCNTISFGVVPQVSLSNVKESKELFLNAKFDIETIEETCKKAYIKSLLFRQKPSKFGIRQAKKLVAMEAVQPHPLFCNVFSGESVKDEMEKMVFLSQLKNFKPKESYFERTNETSVKEEVIKDFKRKAVEFKRKKEIEKKKEKLRAAYEDDDGDQLMEEINEMDEDEDDEGNINPNAKNKINKSKASENQFLGKKQKRSQMKNFRNNPAYISEKKEINNSKLWGDEKPISLDELTMNIAPDDDALTNKKKVVWDPMKKNYVNSTVDRNGQIVKSNESGVRIKSKDKNPQAYLKWRKKNKLRVQRVGEMENEKITGNADTMFKERKMMKNEKNNMKHKGPDNGIKAKVEVKNFDQLLKGKKDKFKKQFGKNFSKKEAKQREIQEKSSLNRRSQVFIKRRTSSSQKKKKR